MSPTSFKLIFLGTILYSIGFTIYLSYFALKFSKKSSGMGRISLFFDIVYGFHWRRHHRALIEQQPLEWRAEIARFEATKIVLFAMCILIFGSAFLIEWVPSLWNQPR